MIYTTTLQSYDTDLYTRTMVAGTLNLVLNFSWPTQIQGLKDNLMYTASQYAASNPLLDKRGRVIRDYDYIDYVLAKSTETLTPLGVADPGAWFTAREKECLAAKAIRDQFDEMLVWNLVIEDGEVTYATNIRGGGYLQSDDDTWKIYFTTSKEDGHIGHDDLYLVQLFVETLNG